MAAIFGLKSAIFVAGSLNDRCILSCFRGRYATVKKCYCKKSRKCFAAKIIKNFRTKNAKLNMNIVENEITALSLARSHTSIVNLYEVFHDRGETILVLE